MADFLTGALDSVLQAGPRLLNWAGSFDDAPGASEGGNIVTGVRLIQGPGGAYYGADMRDPVSGSTWTKPATQEMITRVLGPTASQATPGKMAADAKEDRNKNALIDWGKQQHADNIRMQEAALRQRREEAQGQERVGLGANDVNRQGNAQNYDLGITGAQTEQMKVLLAQKNADRAFAENELNSRRDLLLRGGSAALEARHQGLAGLGDGIARAGELLARAF